MNARALLAGLKASGIELKIENDELKLIGHKAALTDDLLAMLRQHKAEILQALRQEITQTTPVSPCFACGGLRFWLRPTGGWACSRCHPPPIQHVPEVTLLRNLRESLAKAVIELAEAADWPRLPLDGHRTVIGTRHAWIAFSRTADVLTLQVAVEKLKASLGADEGQK